MNREPSRVRDNGTRVTVAANGDERIEAVRRILAEGYAKIDGVMVDHFSASAIVQVYQALNPVNRRKFAGLPVATMATIAFQLIKGGPQS